MIRDLRPLFAAVVIAGSLLLAGASTTLAAEVDPSTLTPPPPPGARCHTTGPARVVCDTVLNQTFENLPDFELPCGVVYLTGTDFREGFRFYEDGLMVRRHVTADLDATATLSPTGDGPLVRMTSHRNWWSVWPVPGGSDDEALYTQAGMDLKFSAPGLGASFQISGRLDPDGNWTGLFTGWSDEAMALLCEVLVG
jgi:hypothetical protein